jgi:hypothetical protein
VIQVGAAVGAIALAVAGAWALQVEPTSQSGAPLMASGRACESRPQVSGRFEADANGEQVLDLDGRAFVRAESGSVVRLLENEPCRLVLSLERGRVDVHAMDLGSGELQVLAGEGRIEVKGTIFSVVRDDGEFTVDVAEGVVEVSSGGDPKQPVGRGERLRRVRRAAERSALEVEEQNRILMAVGVIDADDSGALDEQVAEVDELDELDGPEPSRRRRAKRPRHRSRRALDREVAPVVEVEPEVPEPAPPPVALSALLSEAERLKRAGDLDGARRSLRKAGERSGADARAAWIALARLELQAGRTADVRQALSEYRRRGGGPLEPEGAWILVRAEERAGRVAEARAEAEALLRRWPSTPQAEEARRWLLRADAGSAP